MPAVRRHRRLEVARRARRLGQQFLQQLAQRVGLGLFQHADEAFLVHAVAAGAAGDLVHLGFVERPVVDAVELGQRAEQHAADRQVQAHADRVGGDQDVRLALREALGLAAAHLGRQRAVDHRHRVAAGGDLVAQHQHVAAAEGDHRVAELQRRQRHRLRQQLHVLLALEVAHRAALAAQAEQVLDRRHRIGRADDDQLVGRHADDGLRPGPAARRVEDHLRLVDHRDVDRLARGDHLDRARHHAGRRGAGTFSSPVSSEHGTPRADQPVAAFERQQAQRRQVGAVVRLRQPLEGGVRLAAVRRADVERARCAAAARAIAKVSG